MSRRPWTNQDYWNDRFDAGDIPWDMGAPSPTLVALEKFLRLPTDSAVLVPGCGYGHDAMFFAQRGYKVSAVDWSEIAVQELRQKARRGQVPIEVLCRNFFDLPTAWHSSFDVWVEHTLLCALDLPDRARYFDTVRALLKPGGVWIAALFVSPDEGLKGKPLFQERGGPPFWSSKSEILDFLKDDFEVVRLEESPHAHPARKGAEWWAEARLIKGLN